MGPTASTTADPTGLPTASPTASPTSLPTESPNASPTATEFNCIDNPDYKFQIGRRKNKRFVDGCEYIRNQPNARKCRSSRKGINLRKNCPSSCEEPACTCTDKGQLPIKSAMR